MTYDMQRGIRVDTSLMPSYPEIASVKTMEVEEVKTSALELEQEEALK